MARTTGKKLSTGFRVRDRMAFRMLDTPTLARESKDAGIEPKQADAITHVVTGHQARRFNEDGNVRRLP